MPLYEYRCTACGVQEEKLQGFSAPTEHDCPTCGAPGGMTRQISRTAFAFQGSGWYAQGYGDAAKAGATPASPAGAVTPEAAPTEAPSAPKAAEGCGGGCACH